MKEEPVPDSLRDPLARLPREIEPARDLWPEIHARLDARPVRRFPIRVWLPLAAALVLAALLAWPRRESNTPFWQVDVMAGVPRIGASGHGGRLHLGDWLETDATSRARLAVGDIGEVSIEPNSRLRLVNTAANDHRLELARGTLHALIWAPPRLFFVETPSATAVDLGCAYTLTVDDRGVGVLEVTSGYVALEHGDRESIVPAGLLCLTQPGAGPGTPFSNEASEEFRDALRHFDAGETAALENVLAHAGSTDAISLWHLLARAPSATRGAVFDALAQLQPAPEGVTRAGIVAGDRAMRDRWALELGLVSYAAVERDRPVGP